MQDVSDLMNLALKHSNSRRIGKHQRSNIVIDHARKLFDVHHAQRIRLQISHLIAAHSSSSRIRPMRGIRNQNLLPWIALCLVVRTREQDTGELTMRSSRGLQRDRVHASDLDEAVAQQLHDAERTL